MYSRCGCTLIAICLQRCGCMHMDVVVKMFEMYMSLQVKSEPGAAGSI